MSFRIRLLGAIVLETVLVVLFGWVLDVEWWKTLLISFINPIIVMAGNSFFGLVRVSPAAYEELVEEPTTNEAEKDGFNNPWS